MKDQSFTKGERSKFSSLITFQSLEMKTKLMDGSTPPTLIISQKYRNQRHGIQGEQGAEDRDRPGEGQRGEEAGGGAGDHHSLQPADEGYSQSGDN